MPAAPLHLRLDLLREALTILDGEPPDELVVEGDGWSLVDPESVRGERVRTSSARAESEAGAVRAGIEITAPEPDAGERPPAIGRDGKIRPATGTDRHTSRYLMPGTNSTDTPGKANSRIGRTRAGSVTHVGGPVDVVPVLGDIGTDADSVEHAE